MPKRSTLATGRGKAGKDGARLARLIDDAVVDCCTESEATLGFYNMIDDNLKVPFTAQVLGMEVKMQGVYLSHADEILVSCRRGRFRQALNTPSIFKWISGETKLAQRVPSP